jgi:hypothetical protein
MFWGDENIRKIVRARFKGGSLRQINVATISEISRRRGSPF